MKKKMWLEKYILSFPLYLEQHVNKHKSISLEQHVENSMFNEVSNIMDYGSALVYCHSATLSWHSLSGV
jgi:hypothetical protein